MLADAARLAYVRYRRDTRLRKNGEIYEKVRKLGSADGRSNLADGYVRIRGVERLEQNRSSCFIKAAKREAAAVGYEPARLATAAKALKNQASKRLNFIKGLRVKGCLV